MDQVFALALKIAFLHLGQNAQVVVFASAGVGLDDYPGPIHKLLVGKIRCFRWVRKSQILGEAVCLQRAAERECHAKAANMIWLR